MPETCDCRTAARHAVPCMLLGPLRVIVVRSQSLGSALARWYEPPQPLATYLYSMFERHDVTASHSVPVLR